jgi:hypothetical protein
MASKKEGSEHDREHRGEPGRAGEPEPPEPLADLLAQIAGVLATRIVRGAYMQSMAALVAAGHEEDMAATIAGRLFDRAERDINDVRPTLRRRAG